MFHGHPDARTIGGQPGPVIELRCRNAIASDRVCGAKLGETSVPLRFVGVVRTWQDRRPTDAPRDVRPCPRCHWFNLFVIDGEARAS